MRQYFKVQTIPYRDIDLLLGAKQYGSAIDIWSAGCIVAEIFGMNVPMFNGYVQYSDGNRWEVVNQIVSIFTMLGFPTESDWPGISQRRMYLETMKVFF